MEFSTNKKYLEENRKDVILNSINQVDAWNWILGKSVKLNEYFCNPFRADRKPGCRLKEHNGMIFLMDGRHHIFHGMNVVKAVQYQYNCDYIKALNIIYNDYILKQGIQLKPNRFSYENANKKKSDFRFILKASEDKWKHYDKQYWNQYEIKKSHLLEESIYPTKVVWFNSKKEPDVLKSQKTDFPSYCLRLNNRKKVYQPIKKSFLSTLESTDIGGTIQYKKKALYITKSFKDHLCIKNAGFNSLYLPSEGVRLTNQFVKGVDQDYDVVIFLMDNDDAGQVASKFYESYLPRKSMGTWLTDYNDPADMVKYTSTSSLRVRLSIIQSQAFDYINQAA